MTMLTVNCASNEITQKSKQINRKSIREIENTTTKIAPSNNYARKTFKMQEYINSLHNLKSTHNYEFSKKFKPDEEYFDSRVRFIINDKNMTKMLNDGNTDINDWIDKNIFNLLGSDADVNNVIKKENLKQCMNNKNLIRNNKNHAVQFKDYIPMNEIETSQYKTEESNMSGFRSSNSLINERNFENSNVYERKNLNSERKVLIANSPEEVKYESLHDKNEKASKTQGKIIKGPWTKDEDGKLNELINCFGPKNWSKIAELMKTRIGKQCRERWHNHLHPNIKKTPFTAEEDILVIQLHTKYGNRWSEIAKFLPGRTDNAVKNHWNSALQKKLKKRSYSVQSSTCLRNERCCCSICISQKMQEKRSKSVYEPKFSRKPKTVHDKICSCQDCLNDRNLTQAIIRNEREDVKKRFELLTEEEKIASLALLKLRNSL